MKSLITTSLGLAAAAGAFVMIAVSALSIPDVYTSYETGQCVKVVNYSDDNYSCENMPTRYNNVWVQ